VTIGISSIESGTNLSVGGAGGMAIVESGPGTTAAEGGEGAEWYEGRGGARTGCGAAALDPGGAEA
jgi:hypothetical protein